MANIQESTQGRRQIEKLKKYADMQSKVLRLCSFCDIASCVLLLICGHRRQH